MCSSIFQITGETVKKGKTMEKINTIQKREKLNEVYRTGEPGPGGAYHDYEVHNASVTIQFQKGSRKDPSSRNGVLDSDLLEIVRDRLKSFQSGEFSCRENACALTHIEEALMWLNRRVEDRIERDVIGTMEK